MLSCTALHHCYIDKIRNSDLCRSINFGLLASFSESTMVTFCCVLFLRSLGADCCTSDAAVYGIPVQ
jgi:hypothetical protein